MSSSKRKTSGSKSSFTLSGTFRIIKKVCIYFFAITILWVIIYRFVNPPVTWLMLQRGFERKAEGKAWKVDHKWRDFDTLSNNLKYAAIAGEDAGFMHHWGFDPNAIQKAYVKNKVGKPMRGGSTISQQTAKNVFLWPGRSWLRKGFEAYFTVLIEVFWSKERILEVYLNVIEMGDGIYGAEAACKEYFNKPAVKLTRRQASLLVAVFPNPRKWTPAHPTRYISYKSALIRRNMRIVTKQPFDQD